MTLLTTSLARKVASKLTGKSLPVTVVKLTTAQNVNRTFSNAAPHQHDIIHQNFQGTTRPTAPMPVDPIVTDYWKAHPNEHYSTYASSMSQSSHNQTVVDYWNEHGDTHFAEDKFRRGGSGSGNNERRENFSSSTKQAKDSAEDGDNMMVKDYWADHADTHFTDYWAETKGKTHF